MPVMDITGPAGAQALAGSRRIGNGFCPPDAAPETGIKKTYFKNPILLFSGGNNSSI